MQNKPQTFEYQHRATPVFCCLSISDCLNTFIQNYFVSVVVVSKEAFRKIENGEVVGQYTIWLEWIRSHVNWIGYFAKKLFTNFSEIGLKVSVKPRLFKCYVYNGRPCCCISQNDAIDRFKLIN